MVAIFSKQMALYLMVFIFLSEVKPKNTTPSPLYSVHTNLESVEKLTIDYEKKPHEKRSRIRESLSALITQKKKNRMKLAMCWTFLKDEEYKFEITLLKDDDAFNIECTDRKLQLKIFDQKQLKTGVLKMFRCPSIAESIFLKRAPIYYMMCDFQLKSKAIVFIQEDEHSPLYPYKYLDEIEYDSFEAIYIRMLDKRPPLQPHEYHWLQLYQKQSNDLIQHIQDESAKLESAVRQITDSIKIRSPYTKFQKFYHSIDICGLTFTQKIYICRSLLETDMTMAEEGITIDTSEYTKATCRKFDVSVGLTKTKLISSFQCPPIVYFGKGERRDIWNRTYLPSTFLAKNVGDLQITASQVTSSTSLKCVFATNGFNLQLLQKVRQVEREMLNPREKEILLSKSQNNEYDDANENYQYAFPIAFSRKKAEKAFLIMRKFTEMKFPYRKFRSTYHIKNICMLKQRQRFKLCKTIFENQAIGQEVTPNIKDVPQCTKIEVDLIILKMVFPFEEMSTLATVTCPVPNNRLFTGMNVSTCPTDDCFLILDVNYHVKQIFPKTIVYGLSDLSHDIELDQQQAIPN